MMDRRLHIQPINKLLKAQILVLAITSLIMLTWQGKDSALASAFGGLIVVLNSLLQKWHLYKAVKKAGADPNLNLRQMYLCTIERWGLTVLMLLIGFVKLEMKPEVLLVGFLAAHVAIIFSIKNRT